MPSYGASKAGVVNITKYFAALWGRHGVRVNALSPGGVLGGLFLTFLIPIPILGTLIGALLGTFLGALIGELSVDAKKSTKDAVRPALWATAATLMGNIVKTGLTMAAWLVLMASAIL